MGVVVSYLRSTLRLHGRSARWISRADSRVRHRMLEVSGATTVPDRDRNLCPRARLHLVAAGVAPARAVVAGRDGGARRPVSERAVHAADLAAAAARPGAAVAARRVPVVRARDLPVARGGGEP